MTVLFSWLKYKFPEKLVALIWWETRASDVSRREKNKRAFKALWSYRTAGIHFLRAFEEWNIFMMNNFPQINSGRVMMRLPSALRRSLSVCINWGALVPPGWRQTTPSRRRQSRFPSCTIRAAFFSLPLSPRASLSALYLLNSVQPGCFTTCRGLRPSITAGWALPGPGRVSVCPCDRMLLWSVSHRDPTDTDCGFFFLDKKKQTIRICIHFGGMK